ncbi:MAG TPA: hypothetical protein VEC60_16235 [Reyranella sp.]|nr:hypothetical protein [Reyranella sp.]
MELESRDLGYFAEAVRIAALLEDGFALADVADVPSAWQTIDGSLSFMGWIVELRDGRRVYLRYSVDEAGSGLPQDVRLQALAPGEPPATGDIPVAWFEPLHVKLVVCSGRWLRSKAVVG